MTTQAYIDKNSTSTLKKGDKVVMHTCVEAKYNNGKIWECSTTSYMGKGHKEVVNLNGFAGCFLTKYLQYVDI